MRAIWIKKHGGPEVLEVRESPDPEPNVGEVRIRAKACGLNFSEVSARQGLYPDAPKPPCIVGYEGAGVVDKVGAEVTGIKPGDRALYLTRFGGHSDTVVVPAKQALLMPDEMSFEEGAALPVNYLTAYHMIHYLHRTRPGEHVLIHMAAGGVGTAALQICKHIGGITTYGTASAGKHDYLREQGCTHPIDYRTQDYVAEVRRLTNGRGVNLVLDALGGPDWKKGYSLLRPAGLLIAFGLANTNTGGKRNLFHVAKQIVQVPRYNLMKLLNDNKGIAGVNVGHMWDEIDLLSQEMAELIELYRQGAIRPHIDQAIPFSRAADAWALIEYGKNRGKVVLLPD